MGIQIFLACFVLIAHVAPVAFAQSCQASSCATSAPFAKQQVDQTGRTNYFYLGGVFSVHDAGSNAYICGSVTDAGTQQLEAFMWAVRTFRDRNPFILKGINVGTFAFDVCGSPQKASQQILNLETCDVAYGHPPIEPERVLAYVGPDTNRVALDLAPLLAGMRKTVVSHGAMSGSLTKDSPYFMRTIPSDGDLVVAMVELLKKNNLRYVQMVYSDTQYGKTGYRLFKDAEKTKSICIVNSKSIPMGASNTDLDNIVQSLLDKSNTRIVILFAEPKYIKSILEAAVRKNTRGKLTWISTTEWSKSTEIVKDVEQVAAGAVTFALPSAITSSGVGAFLTYMQMLKPAANTYNPWFKEFWQNRFGCNLPGEPQVHSQDCDVALQSLSDIKLDKRVPYVIQAVDAILAGIEAARRSQCPGSDSLCSGFINNAGKWDIIHDEILKASSGTSAYFNVSTGDVAYPRFNVLSYGGTLSSYTPLAYYDKSTGLSAVQTSIPTFDSNGNPTTNLTNICPNNPCLECGETTLVTSPPTQKPGGAAGTSGGNSSDVDGDGLPPVAFRNTVWVIVLIILAGLGILLTLVFEIYLMIKICSTRYQNKWRTMWLGQLLLFGVFMSYVTLFAFVPTPTKATCGIIRFGIGCSYALCFAVMLVKLMIILSSKTVGYLKGIYQVLMFIFAWGVQIVIDIEWLILVPPKAEIDDVTGVLQCATTYEQHLMSLVYVMFLILITTLIAIKTHGIITNHREGVFIGLVAGFTFPVWIAWTLVGALNKDPVFEEPSIAFGLLATATLILFIMYLPKVRQLNSMGVEGIYAEDDAPDGYAPSIISPPSMVPGSVVPAGSVINGSVIAGSYQPNGYKQQPPPIVYVNGFTEAGPKDNHYHIQSDTIPRGYGTVPRKVVEEDTLDSFATQPNALYLRHPGAPVSGITPSLRSAPPASYLLKARGPGNPDQVYATTRVLKVTNDLTGRMPSDGNRTQSELNYNVQYGTTTRSQISRPESNMGGTLKKHRSLQDLGSL